MDFGNPVVWMIVGLVVTALVVVLVAPRFSSAARVERRRRKSNARIVSKSAKPTVKFSVHTKDRK